LDLNQDLFKCKNTHSNRTQVYNISCIGKLKDEDQSRNF